MASKSLIFVALLMGVGSVATLAGKGLAKGKVIHDAENLRSQGPSGLEEALSRFDKAKANFDKNPRWLPEDVRNQTERWHKAIDQIAGQRHAAFSRLYWYTDLDQARQAAATSGKPILSLRMLGKLTDEHSCANSRFFRTALYSNQEISDVLRKQFVLHWQSVRPVPKVTIDFGDGRTLCRTITGNSAHYILTADAEPLDVLPGLYSPKEFLAWLTRATDFAAKYAHATSTEGAIMLSKSEVLLQYHRARLTTITSDWNHDIHQAAPDLLGGFGTNPFANEGLLFTDAYDIASRATAKAKAEVPILQAIRETPQKTDRMVTDKLWQRIADLHRSEVALDARSRAVIRNEHPEAPQAGRLATSKMIVEDPILKLVRNFENSIALDTVRNKYLLEREIHNWFVRGEVRGDVDSLNERVYAELFLTPSSDPWLGLVPADTYTALESGGLKTPRTQ